MKQVFLSLLFLSSNAVWGAPSLTVTKAGTQTGQRAEGLPPASLAINISKRILRGNEIPQSAKEAAKAVVKINVTEIIDAEFAVSTGTGFAVQSPRGETFIATAAHVIYPLLSGGASLIESLSKNALKAELAAIDIENDLALLKLSSDWNGPHLPISDFIPKEPVGSLGFSSEKRNDNTIKGFKSDKLQYIKPAAATYYSDSRFQAWISLRRLKGASGGPLLDKKGAVVGIISSGGDGVLTGPTSDLLADLLKSADEAGTEHSVVQNSITKQANEMISAIRNDDGRKAVKFSGFIEHFLKSPDLIIEVQRIALKADDPLALYDAAVHFRDKKDYEKALDYLYRSANQGFGLAVFELGKIILSRDLPDAEAAGKSLIQKAAALHEPFALTFLAELEIQKGKKGAKKAEDVLTYLADWGFEAAKEALERLQQILPSQETAPDSSCRASFRKGA